MTSAPMNSVLPTAPSPAQPKRLPGAQAGGFRTALDLPRPKEATSANGALLTRERVASALAMALDGNLAAPPAETREPRHDSDDAPDIAAVDTHAPEDNEVEVETSSEERMIEGAPVSMETTRAGLSIRWLLGAETAIVAKHEDNASLHAAEATPDALPLPQTDAGDGAGDAKLLHPAQPATAAVGVPASTAQRPAPRPGQPAQADTRISAAETSEPAILANEQPAPESDVPDRRAQPAAAIEPAPAFRPPVADGGEPAKPVVGAVVTGQQSFAAPQTPSATVSAALAADPSWAIYFRDVASGTGSPGGVRSLKIQLHPAELGVVTAHLRVQGDSLTVELQADSEQARRHLAVDSEQIVRSLRALGLDIDRVTVNAGPPEDTTQRQQGGSARDGGFASTGSGDGQDARSGAGSRNGPPPGELAADSTATQDERPRSADTRYI